MTVAVQPNGHIAVAPPSQRGLSRVQAAKYVGVSPSTFDKMVSDGMMPGPKRVYSRRIWDVRTLDLAMDALPIEGAEEGEFNEWDDVS